MNIKSDGEPIYGGSDKYTEIKIKVDWDRVNTNFQGKKNGKRKNTMQMVVTDNARFCC